MYSHVLKGSDCCQTGWQRFSGRRYAFLEPGHGLANRSPRLHRHTIRRGNLQVPRQTAQLESATTAKEHTADGTAADAAERTGQVQDSEAEEDAAYVWERNWYPVGIAGDLAKERPHPVNLLNKQLVLWWAPEGTWVAFEDRCPHRLAPLSEGFLNPRTQRLVCAYHGWSFAGDGHCTTIPQADNVKAEDGAKQNPRSCATTYPTQVVGGLVFVWPDASETRFIDAAAAKMPVPPGLEEASAREDTYLRDLPYSYDVLVENLVDPSHLPFSHHGQYGQDQADAAALRMRPAASPTTEGFEPTVGFQFEPLSSVPGSLGSGTTQVEYHAPSLIWYHSTARERPAPDLILYAVPTVPGRSRIFQQIVPRKEARSASLVDRLRDLLVALSRPAQLLSLLGGYGPVTPRWIRHLAGLAVDDGDAIVLHHQDRLLQADKLAGKSWDESCFIPTTADRGLSWVRRWLTKKGVDRFSLPDISLDPLPRRQLLDRYEQHVRLCPHCSRALGFFEVFHYTCRFLAQALCTSALMLFIIAIGLHRGVPMGAAQLWGAITPYSRKFAVVGMVFAILSYVACKKVIPRFHFVDYVHSGRHG